MADRWSRFVARTLGLVAPGMAIGFLRRRAILNSYAGASRAGADKAWNPTTQSADAILSRDRVRLMARARDLERNSAHVAGAINRICNNAIYTGIFPQARLKDAEGKQDKDRNDLVEGHWNDWAKAVDYYDLQELVLRHLWVDGECFVLRYFDEDLAEKGIVPMGVEVLESDMLDTSKEGEAGPNKIKGGIEYDFKGKPVAYYIYRDHPGDTHAMFGSTAYGESRRVRAKQIKHLFHKRRASQHRGITWLATLITEMRDFSEYQASERIAARLVSAFGIFIESPYPEHQAYMPIYGTDKDQTEGAESTVPQYLESGRIDTLPPGMKVSAAQFQRPGQTYEPYTKTSLKNASVGTGLSYENFSNDYEGATYSSARQALLEERRGYRKLQYFLNRHLNEWTWKKWLGYAGVAGIIKEYPVPVQWQNPGWPWIDPAKDAMGAQRELAMKITTRRRLAAERGLDWDEEIQELAEEEQTLEELGLKEDIDAGAIKTQDSGGGSVEGATEGRSSEKRRVRLIDGVG